LKSGSHTSWNPKGLSRPVMGLLYHLPIFRRRLTCYLHLRGGPEVDYLNYLENGGAQFIRNVVNYLQIYMASY
jgi:hypothetical protein